MQLHHPSIYYMGPSYQGALWVTPDHTQRGEGGTTPVPSMRATNASHPPLPLSAISCLWESQCPHPAMYEPLIPTSGGVPYTDEGCSMSPNSRLCLCPAPLPACTAHSALRAPAGRRTRLLLERTLGQSKAAMCRDVTRRVPRQRSVSVR